MSSTKSIGLKQVKVRKQHECSTCNKTIAKGEVCMTCSIKFKPRYYFCQSCYNKLHNKVINLVIGIDDAEDEPDVDFLNHLY